jgi:ubiquinone/menaquinone biosynthesis C-methylase UbiE
MDTNEEEYKASEQEYPKIQINLNPIRRFFERSIDHPIRHLEPFVTNGQVVADLGCDAGYYTLALAECAGPVGKVYVVDLDEKKIQALEEKVEWAGYHNIEARASSAADLSFIENGSVDFVLANGLL